MIAQSASAKNCNLPGVKVDLPVLQEKDKKDLIDFGIHYDVDFVAASFVQSADDIRLIRETLGGGGKNIKIISKIENQEGLVNFDEIVAESDGIMVARGDLGMEIPAEKVFLAQKIMIAKCNLMGKPVMTATQMLESMVNAPRPTRAEAGDVANAVLDGTDCVMLSGETAGGDFPVEAVTIMRRIVEEAERTLDYNAIYAKTRLAVLQAGVMTDAEATCSSAVEAAFDLAADAIICMTQTGSAARHIAKYRPGCVIFGVSPNEQTVRQMACLRDVVPFLAVGKWPFTPSTDKIIQDVMDHGQKIGVLKTGSVVIAVTGESGSNPFQAGGSNLIKIIRMENAQPGGRMSAPSSSDELDDPRKALKTYSQAPMLLPKDMAALDMHEQAEDSFTRKCKIVCTMGPSCWSVENLCKLVDAGMNVARLNFSHGDHDSHGACVDRIREASQANPDKPLAILLDTKGPEIRTGFFASGDKIRLTKGQDLKLVVDYSFKGDNTCIAVSYEKLPTAVKPGNNILIADGSLVLKVKSCGSDHVITEVMNNCAIGERKNCNLPGVKVDLPVLLEKDKKDLVEFGIPNGVHFIAASFVQSAADVKSIRDTLGEKGKHIHIISKIENQEGLNNFDEIAAEGDAIMVARGDLGMEIPPEKVFLAQKIMIAKCNLRGKPVITATQMLESMINAPRPTRAEAGDVANAVLDGSDCVMLSGETAGGSFPCEAVSIMRRIVEEAERSLDYRTIYSNVRESLLKSNRRMPFIEGIASTAAKTAADVDAPLILVITRTGQTVRQVAKYRPKSTILAITGDDIVARQLLTLRGVISYTGVSGVITDVDAAAHKAVAYAQRVGITGLTEGVPVVVLATARDGTHDEVIKVVHVR